MKLDTKHLIKKFTKPSLGYELCNRLLVSPYHRLYYRKYYVLHKERIPKNAPFIFVMNHQNALMDALVIVCSQPRQAVFVARADIFKNKQIRKILFFLRILPIFRKRDGGESKENNQETFEVVDKILSSNTPFAMMPEGNHGEFKRLRPLQKGVFRIAMQEQEKHQDQPSIKIVPIGIDYENSQKFYKNITITFGEPIELSEYYREFEENQAKALNSMQGRLATEMKKYIVNIESETFYKEIERLQYYFGPDLSGKGRGKKYAEKLLHTRQKIAIGLSDLEYSDIEALKEISDETKEYIALQEKLGIRHQILSKRPYAWLGLFARFLLLLVGSPLWLFGIMINALPYSLGERATKLFKDKQFISSGRFVAGMLLYAIFHLILIILSIVFIKNSYLCLAVIALIACSGRFTLWHGNAMKRWIAAVKYKLLKMRKSADLLKMEAHYQALLAKLTAIIRSN